MEKYFSNSEEETIAIGEAIGQKLPSNSIICFFGELAAGKTTFIKGLTLGAAKIQTNQVHSPTFSYLHIYQGIQDIFHFDLYRMRDADEFLSMGFDEFFEAGGICCIEWSERIASLLPHHCIKIEMVHEGGDARSIIIHTP